MKILLISQHFWPENFLINSLVPQLITRGIDVTVLTGKPNYPGGKIYPGYNAGGIQVENLEGAKIIRLPIIPRGRGSTIGLSLNYLSFIFSGFIYANSIMKNQEYDLVFVYATSPLLQALPGTILADCKNVPLVVWVQDLWPDSLSATNHITNRYILRMIRYIVKFIYNRCDRILVQSQGFTSSVAALTNNPGKIFYYPNFYAENVNSRPSHKAQNLIRILRSCFSIVFAGNLGTAQSLDTIIIAARLLLRYENIRIVLVGSGSMDIWLKQQQSAYGLHNLILAGRFEPTDMPTIFESSSALLVSLRGQPVFNLTVPSKIQAYLAAGRPIIASLGGEGARIIHDSRSGLCSEPGNAEELVKNIIRLSTLTSFEREQMGVNGRQYFQHNYSLSYLINELIKHLEDATRGLEKS